MSIGIEAARLLLVSGLLAVGMAAIRGLPTLPPAAPEALTCAPPGADSEAATPAPVTEGTLSWISPDDAAALYGRPSVVFVDARGRAAFEAGHVAGAISAPVAETGAVDPSILAVLREARTVVTYCDTSGGCAASTRLARLLASAGIADVRVLEGGIAAWLERDLPAEAGECRHCP
ncbi:MAG: rhodanese-like domain-containing protein [Myxococcota bacterium]|nr:rhodanese-like domain-containing protein [Myxococcota bacterium]MDW8362613.1 rhodanese-like domain-containing protein [Myxococcales bacterium]